MKLNYLAHYTSLNKVKYHHKHKVHCLPSIAQITRKVTRGRLPNAYKVKPKCSQFLVQVPSRIRIEERTPAGGG